MSIKALQPIKPGRGSKTFRDPAKAVQRIREIYDRHVAYLRECFERFCCKDSFSSDHVAACYPYIRFKTNVMPSVDRRLSYGFVTQPGVYETTVTRPDIFDHYYREQLALLCENHSDARIEIGVSTIPIPLHFALGEDFYLEGQLSAEKLEALPALFDLPDLNVIDDRIADGIHLREGVGSGAQPLALFTAPRVDVSLQRLKHYTGTSAEHFQNFVIYTNYQFYIDEFVRHGMRLMAHTEEPELAKSRSAYTAFVEPGNKTTHNANLKGGMNAEGFPRIEGGNMNRIPQMPAYHLKKANGSGITMINIGVGPSNAKNITDHVAVLRPHAWLMLGHCAGLRNSQQLGDYVLAHAYIREDAILDDVLPLSVPIPALSEMQVALAAAMMDVTGLEDYEFKKMMRTGTVASVNDRNWELHDQNELMWNFSQSRAIALDMESATIAANGFRFRVPYGTLLCVSDKPLHGQLKLPGMADEFYRERVDQHLKIGILAMEKLCAMGKERLHSRKLRSFTEVAFQ
ncbi:MAG: AMP nucleosidase [Micavibrio sp.]|nr:MAG: AMP nucleosidase [Micavibrio sp.]